MPAGEFPAYEALRAVAGSRVASVVLCDNPSQMTMEGTNSVVLRAPGAAQSVVVDPGPEDAGHAKALAEAAGAVTLVLITHRHGDHTDGIDEFVRLTGAPVRALLSEHCRGTEPLVDGEVVEVAGLRIGVVATPGHTADSISLDVALAGGETDCVVLGDTILGRDSTVLDSTDGSLPAYLDSLRELQRFAGRPGVPGHGPDAADVSAAAAALEAHRNSRLEQVREAIARLGADAGAAEITRDIYTEVTDQVLLAAAEQSTRVAMDYIAERG